jgi:hypothetical protein
MITAIRTQGMMVEKSGLSILKALAYFDIFNYPLTEQEIKIFLNNSIRGEEFGTALQTLLCKKVIFKINEFYSLQNKFEIVQRRIRGNFLANELLLKATRIGAFLYQFPFVRGVAISGSLSKGYADAKTDIDFFIITKADRLWMTRTLLHLFKKFTFLFGKQHFYCMNYFIDEKALFIQEQNIYLTMEVVTLVPVAGTDVVNNFFRINNWTEVWLPNYTREKNTHAYNKDLFLKRMFEKFLNKKWGNRLENFLFEWTTLRWKEKERFGRKNSNGKVMNLVTGQHFSKSNPGDFQEKILSLYENKICQLKNQWLQYFD